MKQTAKLILTGKTEVTSSQAIILFNLFIPKHFKSTFINHKTNFQYNLKIYAYDRTNYFMIFLNKKHA